MKRQFGVGFKGENDINSTIAYAKIADDLGYQQCWVAEDYFFAGAFTMATACAANTKNINIGIGVLNPFTRHPALIAMEAAALYYFSGGRLTLGLGSSNKIWMEKQMGIPFTKIIKNLSECMSIIKAMLKEDSASFEGDIFQISDARLRVKGCEDLPIFLGVKSENLLRLAAAEADGILLSSGTSLPYVKWAKERLAEGAEKAGRDLKEFAVAAYLIFSIDEDRALARNRCRERIAYYMGLHGDHPILRCTGMTAEEIMPFREAFLAGSLRTDLVTEKMIDTFTVSGTPDECREKLQCLLDAGVTHPVVFDYNILPMEENMKRVKEHLFDLV